MKPLNFFAATRLANMLAITGDNLSADEKELASYADIMRSYTKVLALLRSMDPTDKDMRICRVMFAAELMRPEEPRVSVLRQCLLRHERLHTVMRTTALLEELPTLAVSLDRVAAVHPTTPPMGGGELQSTLRNALFGGTGNGPQD